MKQPMIEKLGLEKVPTELKSTTWIEYFIIQLAFSVNAGNFLIPALAVLEGGLSFQAAFIATVLGASVAFLFVSFLSLPGSRYGLPAQYVLRSIIGTRLSMLIASPIRSLTSLYWFSVQTIGGTFVIISMVEKVTPYTIPFVPVAIGLAIIMTLLALIGFEAVKKATKLFIPILVIGQGIILYLFLTKGADSLTTLNTRPGTLLHRNVPILLKPRLRPIHLRRQRIIRHHPLQQKRPPRILGTVRRKRRRIHDDRTAWRIECQLVQGSESIRGSGSTDRLQSASIGHHGLCDGIDDFD